MHLPAFYFKNLFYRTSGIYKMDQGGGTPEKFFKNAGQLFLNAIIIT